MNPDLRDTLVEELMDITKSGFIGLSSTINQSPSHPTLPIPHKNTHDKILTTIADIIEHPLPIDLECIQKHAHRILRCDHIKEDLGTPSICVHTNNIYIEENDPSYPGICGLRITSKGIPFLGFCTGSDWEYPIFMALWHNEKKLQLFIPIKGNAINPECSMAFGNDLKADELYFKKNGIFSEEYPFDLFEIAPKLINVFHLIEEIEKKCK